MGSELMEKDCTMKLTSRRGLNGRRIRGESRITNRIEDIKEEVEDDRGKEQWSRKAIEREQRGMEEKEIETETEVSNCCREGAHGAYLPRPTGWRMGERDYCKRWAESNSHSRSGLGDWQTGRKGRRNGQLAATLCPHCPLDAEWQMHKFKQTHLHFGSLAISTRKGTLVANCNSQQLTYATTEENSL